MAAYKNDAGRTDMGSNALSWCQRLQYGRKRATDALQWATTAEVVWGQVQK